MICIHITHTHTHTYTHTHTHTGLGRQTRGRVRAAQRLSAPTGAEQRENTPPRHTNSPSHLSACAPQTLRHPCERQCFARAGWCPPEGSLCGVAGVARACVYVCMLCVYNVYVYIHVCVCVCVLHVCVCVCVCVCVLHVCVCVCVCVFIYV